MQFHRECATRPRSSARKKKERKGRDCLLSRACFQVRTKIGSAHSARAHNGHES